MAIDEEITGYFNSSRYYLSEDEYEQIYDERGVSTPDTMDFLGVSALLLTSIFEPDRVSGPRGYEMDSWDRKNGQMLSGSTEGMSLAQIRALYRAADQRDAARAKYKQEVKAKREKWADEHTFPPLRSDAKPFVDQSIKPRSLGFHESADKMSLKTTSGMRSAYGLDTGVAFNHGGEWFWMDANTWDAIGDAIGGDDSTAGAKINWQAMMDDAPKGGSSLASKHPLIRMDDKGVQEFTDRIKDSQLLVSSRSGTNLADPNNLRTGGFRQNVEGPTGGFGTGGGGLTPLIGAEKAGKQILLANYLDMGHLLHHTSAGGLGGPDRKIVGWETTIYGRQPVYAYNKSDSWEYGMYDADGKAISAQDAFDGKTGRLSSIDVEVDPYTGDVTFTEDLGPFGQAEYTSSGMRERIEEKQAFKEEYAGLQAAKDIKDAQDKIDKQLKLDEERKAAKEGERSDYLERIKNDPDFADKEIKDLKDLIKRYEGTDTNISKIKAELRVIDKIDMDADKLRNAENVRETRERIARQYEEKEAIMGWMEGELEQGNIPSDEDIAEYIKTRPEWDKLQGQQGFFVDQIKETRLDKIQSDHRDDMDEIASKVSDGAGLDLSADDIKRIYGGEVNFTGGGPPPALMAPARPYTKEEQQEMYDSHNFPVVEPKHPWPPPTPLEVPSDDSRSMTKDPITGEWGPLTDDRAPKVHEGGGAGKRPKKPEVETNATLLSGIIPADRPLDTDREDRKTTELPTARPKVDPNPDGIDFLIKIDNEIRDTAGPPTKDGEYPVTIGGTGEGNKDGNTGDDGEKIDINLGGTGEGKKDGNNGDDGEKIDINLGGTGEGNKDGNNNNDGDDFNKNPDGDGKGKDTTTNGDEFGENLDGNKGKGPPKTNKLPGYEIDGSLTILPDDDDTGGGFGGSSGSPTGVGYGDEGDLIDFRKYLGRTTKSYASAGKGKNYTKTLLS